MTRADLLEELIALAQSIDDHVTAEDVREQLHMLDGTLMMEGLTE